MIPKKRINKLSIAIPSSLLSQTSHLREKTRVIGQIGRAAVVFRVDEIIIYPDESPDSKLIKLILMYLDTPQYLRRRLFRKLPELKYVGILPPLRTPSHLLRKQTTELEQGEIREGVITKVNERESWVEVGLEKTIKVKGRPASLGSRVNIKVIKTKPEPYAEFIGKKKVDIYWGYNVHISKKVLGELALSTEFDLTLATSKFGLSFKKIENQLHKLFKSSKKTLVAFGSPKRGIKEILSEEDMNIDEVFQMIINFIPQQGTSSIRTEESLFSTLAVLNIIDHK